MGVISPKSKVLIGVGGGIAAYKTVHVASSLFQKGFQTHVAMTPAARKFVKPITFSAVTNQPVLTRLFSNGCSSEKLENIYPHLYPATGVDICIIAPATADLIAKIAHGLADDIVTTSALSLPKSCMRYFCPAMNLEMWNQQVVQKNVSLLEDLGWRRIGPDAGKLACGSVGPGRMSEPDKIVRQISEEFKNRDKGKNKRFLILSGPTVEQIDPVRFISNHSSGKMGKALAEMASFIGAKVDFITGPVAPENLPKDPLVEVINVKSAHDMLTASEARFREADAVIFVAAVSDFTPLSPTKGKFPKPKVDFSIKLTNTPDIASTLCKSKRAEQICVGFALETDKNAVGLAQSKLEKKGLDAIILNGLDSFDSENGDFCLIFANSSMQMEKWGTIPKSLCAKRLINQILALLDSKS